MKKRLDFWDILLRIMYTFIGIGVLIGIFIIIRIYVMDQFAIPTDSMRPTLIPGDYVIVNKLIAGARIYDRLDFKDGDQLKCHRTKGFRTVKHNDVVIFNFPLNKRRNKIEFKINYVYAKRCIGLPGDTVEIRNGYFINNHYNGILGIEEEQYLLAATPDSLLAHNVIHAFPFDFQHHHWTIKEFGPLYIPQKGGHVMLDTINFKLYRLVIEYETGKKLKVNSQRQMMLGDEPINCYTFQENYYFFVETMY
jgi:signal peptidase I